MRIEWTPALRPATQRRDDRAAGAERTFNIDQSETTAGAGAQAPRAADAMAGLLFLQEISDELTGRRRAVAHGERLLDALDGLRLGLLAGSVPRSQLAALAQLAQDHVALTDDPRLAEILAEIELRAGVELAKLEPS